MVDWPDRKNANRFELIAGDGEKISLLWVAKVLLLFRLNTDANKNGTSFLFQHYMEFTPEPHEEDREMGSVCLKYTSTDEKHRNKMAEEELNKRTSLNEGQ